MSKAEEILKSKKWSIEYPNYMHESDILSAMKEAMDDAFEGGANYYEDNEDMLKFGGHIKPINKEQFIKDYFGE